MISLNNSRTLVPGYLIYLDWVKIYLTSSDSRNPINFLHCLDLNIGRLVIIFLFMILMAIKIVSSRQQDMILSSPWVPMCRLCNGFLNKLSLSLSLLSHECRLWLIWNYLHKWRMISDWSTTPWMSHTHCDKFSFSSFFCNLPATIKWCTYEKNIFSQAENKLSSKSTLFISLGNWCFCLRSIKIWSKIFTSSRSQFSLTAFSMWWRSSCSCILFFLF